VVIATLALRYTGHSIGLVGDVIVVVAVCLSLGWRYRRRRGSRREIS
jgi:hypothetical protein